MIISFGDYSYYGDVNSNYHTNEDYKYNPQYFQQLITKRQFFDAANYLKNFRFNNDYDNNANTKDIKQLEHLGRLYGAVFDGKPVAKKDKDAISFIDNVYVDGGFENLKSTFEKGESNSYFDKFNKLKNQLGSSETNTTALEDFLRGYGSYNPLQIKAFMNTPPPQYKDDAKADATTLSIQFKKYSSGRWNSFLNLFREDELNNSLEEFYDKSGLTEAQLKSAGVKFDYRDGSTFVEFDKSNPLANEILLNIPMYDDIDIYRELPFSTEKKDYYANLSDKITIWGKNENGELTRQDWSYDDLVRLEQMQNIYKEAKDKKDTIFKEYDPEQNEDMTFSSVVGAPLFDGLSELNDAAAQGIITEQEYNKMYAMQYANITNLIGAIGTQNYDIYSNYYNGTSDDSEAAENSNEQLETLNPVENKTDLIDYVSSVMGSSPKRVSFLSMYSNGQYGVLIDIKADKSDDKAKRRVQVFIPGLLSEEAQSKISNDTSLNAVAVVDDLQNYHSKYKTVDNKEIYAENNNFYLDGRLIEKDYAMALINKDNLIKDGGREMIYKYTNANGELTNIAGLEKEAREFAIAAGNEIYPGTNVTDTEGNALTPENLFEIANKIKSGDSDAAKRKYNISNNAKLEEILNIYWAIMAKANEYQSQNN